MEQEVCLYQKYGFCKFKDSCMKKHLKEECKDLNSCKTKKICDKRHPKLCRRYVSDQNCTYGEDCEYLHEGGEKIPEGNKLEKRVEELENIIKEKSLAENKMEVAVREMEKVVKAMARKVVYLEEEIVNLKNAKQTDPNEPFKDTSNFTNSTPKSLDKDLTKQEQKVVLEKENGVDEKVEGKGKSSKSKKEDTIKKGEQLKGGESQDMKGSTFQCKICSFKGRTKKSLEKHVDSEHESNLTCDVCGKSVLSSEALKYHIKSNHQKSFVFSESMLDEFI